MLASSYLAFPCCPWRSVSASVHKVRNRRTPGTVSASTKRHRPLLVIACNLPLPSAFRRREHSPCIRPRNTCAQAVSQVDSPRSGRNIEAPYTIAFAFYAGRDGLSDEACTPQPRSKPLILRLQWGRHGNNIVLSISTGATSSSQQHLDPLD